jgi:tetratricopeptide (TPR) repeat protein
VITGRYSDGTQIWSGNQDDNWNSPASFTANKTGTVYIEVKPYSSGGSGSYGLVFSTGSTRPAASAAAAPVNPAPAVSSADANSSVAAVTRGATHFNNREYDRAITEFTEAIRLNPNNAGAYGWRGAAYYRKSDWDRAIADHTEAIRLEPTASRYYDRGLAYYEKRDYRQARTDVDRALQIDPNHQNSQTLSGYIRQAAAPASGGSSWTTPSNAVALNANQWRNGSLTSGGSVWYSFIANGGYSYRIWVDDADARGTPTTADVGIMVRYSDGTQIWSDYQDDNWNSPASFTANRTGTVYIEVKPLGRGSGSYGLVFSSGSSTRPPQ